MSNDTTFIESDCTIEHNGQKFESGGSWLADCTDGYRRGVVYVGPSCVTTWKGELIAAAELGFIYRGNFCRMQAVTFTYRGVKYHGRYCPDWSQAVRVRSTKKVAEVHQ